MQHSFRVAFLTRGTGEVSWSVIRQLEIVQGITLLVVQTQPTPRIRFQFLYNYFVTRFRIFLREKIYNDTHPALVRPHRNHKYYVSSDINSDEVWNLLNTFQPDVLAISGTKIVSTKLLSLATYRINLHHGFVPLYRGVSSIDWVTLERNFNYYYATVHEAVSKLDAGNVVGSTHVQPYYREPLNLFRRRLNLAGARLLVDTICSWPNVPSIPQNDNLLARNFRHSDKTHDHTEKLKSTYSSADMERYMLLQIYSWNSLNLPLLMSKGLKNMPRGIVPRLTWLAKEKRFCKGVVSLAKKSAALKALRRIERNHLPNGFYIVNYHEICDDKDEGELRASGATNIYIGESKFLSHLEYLGENFKCVPLHEGIELWRHGKCQNERIVSITFDDGLSSSLRYLEAMNNHGLTPSLFLCGDPLLRARPLMIHKGIIINQFPTKRTHLVDNLSQHYDKLVNTGFGQTDEFSAFVANKYLTVDDVRQKRQSQEIGFLGSHTWDHTELQSDDAHTQNKKIKECHYQVLNKLGADLRYFSYPFGKLNRHSFISEYIAHSMCRDIFHCNGGINVNPEFLGSILRIAVPNVDDVFLDRLLRIQWTR